MSKASNHQRLGWREWIGLPELGIERIKAKVDTGARTSALHTFHLETFRRDQRRQVRFYLHPYQHTRDIRLACEAEVADERPITDSGGHRELRLVIHTPILVGDHQYHVEITLTNRDNMRFRMLLGRTALRGQYIIDPSVSYLAGEPAVANPCD